MQRPLQEHITLLQQKIHTLRAQANDIYRTSGERFQATVDLALAERALDHFRKAYEIEQKVMSLKIQTDPDDSLTLSRAANGRGVSINGLVPSDFLGHGEPSIP